MQKQWKHFFYTNKMSLCTKCTHLKKTYIFTYFYFFEKK